MAAEPRRFVVFGPTGQVGAELLRALAPLGTVIPVARGEADFERPETLSDVVRRYRPHVVVNAAAYTAVERAEEEPLKALLVNGIAPGVLAEATNAIGACLVHYSTDYVFDGRADEPYREDTPAAPLQSYGRSKLLGERLVRHACARHLIVRTSWVFAARGTNFLRTMIRHAGLETPLRVVDDQHGAPTSAALIADVTARMIHIALDGPTTPVWGVYHLSAAGETTWHGYASYALDRAAALGIQPARRARLDATDSASYGARARRPASSRLDTARLRSTFAIPLPTWQQEVDRVLEQLRPAGAS